MRITVSRVQNGYIVYDAPKERYADVSDDNMHVFESFSALSGFMEDLMPLQVEGDE